MDTHARSHPSQGGISRCGHRTPPHQGGLQQCSCQTASPTHFRIRIKCQLQDPGTPRLSKSQPAHMSWPDH
eukprot:14273133-Heterocapsa_arctica.AAC.1